MPGDRLHQHRFTVHEPDPSHAEFPGFDGEPAGFSEQLVAIPYADDEAIDARQHRVHPVEALDLFFCLLALGDVFRNARRAIGPAAFVKDRKAASPDPAHAFIGANNAVRIVELAARRTLGAFCGNALTIVGVDRIAPGSRVSKKAFPRTPPDVLVSRTTRLNFRVVRTCQEKHFVDVFRHLAKTLLASAQIFFGLLSLRHVLERVKPSHLAFGAGLTSDRLHDLSNVAPPAVLTLYP